MPILNTYYMWGRLDCKAAEFTGNKQTDIFTHIQTLGFIHYSIVWS